MLMFFITVSMQETRGEERRSGDFHSALWYARNLFSLLVRETCCVSLPGRVTGRVFHANLHCTVVARSHLRTHILFIQQPGVNIKQRVCHFSCLRQHLHVEKAFIFSEERPSNASMSTELELEVVVDGLWGQPCKTLFLIWAFALEVFSPPVAAILRGGCMHMLMPYSLNECYMQLSREESALQSW